MAHRRCARTLPTALLLCVALIGPEARADLALGEFQGITVAVADDFACGERVKIRLSASDPALFADSQRMEQLVGVLRAMLDFECDTVKDVMLEGFAGGKTVYRAVTSEKSRWALLNLTPSVAAEGAPPAVASAAPETSAAETAGKSFLPQLPESGAAQTTTREPPRAVDPAAMATTRPEESVSSPGAPADAFATMGENLGSSPQDIDFGDFNQPTMIEAFFTGDFDLIPKDDFSVMLYINSFNQFFSQSVNFIDQSCVLLYRPAIQKRVFMDSQSMVLGSGSVEQQGLHVMEMMGRFMLDMQRGGPQALADRATNIDLIKDQAEKDAVRLAMRPGCKSESTKRIYANMEAFVFGTAPILSPEVARRRQLASFTAAASDSCMRQYAREEFCSCMVGSLEQLQMEDADWGQIGQEFTAVARLGGKYASLRDSVLTCAR